MPLNYLDYIVLAILAIFAIRGYLKGFIIGLATVAALVLGIYAAMHFSGFLDTLLIEKMNASQKWVPVLSYTLTFLLVVLGVMLVAKVTEKFVDMVGMGFFNHLGGALLGVVKGAILAGLLFFILTAVDTEGKFISEKDRQGSFFCRKVTEILPVLKKWQEEKIGKTVK